MATRVRFKIAKYLGDGVYDWAVFDNGRSVYTGCAQREAAYYRDTLRKEAGVK